MILMTWISGSSGCMVSCRKGGEIPCRTELTTKRLAACIPASAGDHRLLSRASLSLADHATCLRDTSFTQLFKSLQRFGGAVLLSLLIPAARRRDIGRDPMDAEGLKHVRIVSRAECQCRARVVRFCYVPQHQARRGNVAGRSQLLAAFDECCRLLRLRVECRCLWRRQCWAWTGDVRGVRFGRVSSGKVGGRRRLGQGRGHRR